MTISVMNVVALERYKKISEITPNQLVAKQR